MQGAKGEPVIAGQAQHGPFEQMDIKRASLRLEFGAKPRLSNSFLQQGAFSLPVRRGTVPFPAGALFAALSKEFSLPYALPGRVPRRVWRC